MANPEHVNLLNKGVKAWNAWRAGNLKVWPDLRGADLIEVDLSGANLSRANLSGVGLSEADLSGADLSEADLSEADLSEANLSGANLHRANLLRASLNGANLSKAILMESRPQRSRPQRSQPQRSQSQRSHTFVFPILPKQISLMPYSGGTLLSAEDLSSAIGLESAQHYGPSTIGIDHIFLLQRVKFPEIFLRGAGVPDEFIDYAKSLTGKGIEFYSVFISYSSKDGALAERLHADLQTAGVRCWFAPEDLKIGGQVPLPN